MTTIPIEEFRDILIEILGREFKSEAARRMGYGKGGGQRLTLLVEGRTKRVEAWRVEQLRKWAAKELPPIFICRGQQDASGYASHKSAEPPRRPGEKVIKNRTELLRELIRISETDEQRNIRIIALSLAYIINDVCPKDRTWFGQPEDSDFDKRLKAGLAALRTEEGGPFVPVKDKPEGALKK